MFVQNINKNKNKSISLGTRMRAEYINSFINNDIMIISDERWFGSIDSEINDSGIRSGRKSVMESVRKSM